MDDLLSVNPVEDEDIAPPTGGRKKAFSGFIVNASCALEADAASSVSSPISPNYGSRNSVSQGANGNLGSGSSNNSATGRIHSSSSMHSNNSQSNAVPPAFNDLVKRSTRFITAVPAHEVLEKVEAILESVRRSKGSTPIGNIGKVELNWDRYRLEVWGADTAGAALCALQLYQMPSCGTTSGSTSLQSSPERTLNSFQQQQRQHSHHQLSLSGAGSQIIAYSPATASLLETSPFVVGSLGGTLPSSSPSFSLLAQSQQYQFQQQSQPQLYLVEFIRGQLEIFAFKRFYQWVRQSLSELVKRDYSIRLFEHAASPM